MRFPVTDEQKKFLKMLGIEDRDYTVAELETIAEETVYDYLMSHGWKPGPDFEETNEIGDMCEDIIQRIYTETA